MPSMTTKELSFKFQPLFIPQLTLNSGGYTHLGFEVLQRVNGLGLVKLRFHVTLGDAVTQ